MTRTRSLSSLGLAALALLALPLRSDGGADECFTTSQSYDATIHTVSGDESFFKLPVGPANVMLLLDNSGSMDQLVQCGDGGFSSGSSRCYYPTTGFSTPAAASGTAVGSCTVSGNNGWMNLKDAAGLPLTKVTAPTLVDPGHGAVANSIGLLDAPPWGTGCAGDACLFDKDRLYAYGSWSETGAVSQPDSRPRTGAGATYRHFTGPGVSVDVVASATCDACLAGSGFCFQRGRYCSQWRVGRSSCEATSTFGPTLLLTGWWLNANPPKFATARKVIKDVVWIDPTKPSNLDQARFGLAVLNPSTTNGNRIVVPVGPGKAESFPVNQAAMVQARQLILDAMNRIWPAGVTVSVASGSTPIAPALANVGQYFSSPGVYPAKLGVADSAFYTETTPGQMQAPWAAGNCSVCWACQASAVILVTDGAPNNERGTNPSTIYSYTPPGMRTYSEASYVSNCGAATSYTNCRSSSDGNPTYVPRVAAWLQDTDLRTDYSVSNPQNLTTSAIGYGIQTAFGGTSTWNILETTAKMGGGKAYDAASPQELADSIVKAVTEVVDRANSFSAPAASSLSTIHTAASEAFITRFKPNETAAWEGHVFQGLLFDEFLNGCDPTKTPTEQPQVTCGTKQVYPNFNGNQDKDGFSICTDVFLVDLDCDEVIEDPKTGEFFKKGTGNQPAVLVWDAGKVLSTPGTSAYRTARTGLASSRQVWTWLPGVAGGAVDLTPANAAKLAPFLNLEKQWCVELLTAAKLCGGATGVACPTLAGWTAANTTTCATAVVNYARGFDVLDADGDNCGGPGVNAGCVAVAGVKPDGEERDRVNDGRASPSFWKLGDVFHSSPVLLKPPADELLCDTGYENQCLPTLRSPGEYNEKAVQTPIDTYDDACAKGSDAYEAWRYDQRRRQRLVLIGANDGMLHAFNAGTPKVGVPEEKGCLPVFDQGDGAEVWAFVPTDLLPRLKDTLFAHQYMVDGSTMVRDVWVDVNKDGTKQRDEYRSVAVITERSGGSTFTALDVTDPTKPAFLWAFPPPGSVEQRWMGQSWSDFAPRPPPIGPVKLKLQAGEKDPSGRGFTERWVAVLNGGYDPAMSLGAAVWMVDVITGQVLWRYTNDDFKKQYGYGTGTSMFPIPGAVALADIGDPTQTRFNNDGFFDTASWGDLGGNLFVARFHEPGAVDATTGRVTNWFAGRAFEQQRRADDLQFAAGRGELFFMPELAWEPVKKALHAYTGSGNRERMMQQAQGCGPDNVLSCCKSGCDAVSASTTADFGACTVTSAFSCVAGKLDNAPLDDACGVTVSCGAAPTNGYVASTKLDFTCPDASASAGGSVTCDANGVCGKPTATGDKDVGGTYAATCTRSKFYGVLAYGGHTEKMFTDAATVAAFEKARYTDVPFTDAACASTGKSCSLVDTTRSVARVDSPKPDCPTGVTKCWALNSEPGWFYEYGVVCPATACADFGACSAEKTGSGALVTFSCVLWNGFQPIGAQGGSDPCTGNVGTPLAFGYATEFVSGTPKAGCGYTYPPDTVLYRGQQRASVSPPSAPLLRITAGKGGGVRYGGLQLDPGAAPEAKSTGERSDFAEPVYWLEVDRQSHRCRHDENATQSACD